MTSFRKDTLLRLRKFMNEVLIDQLPMLGDMHRALEEMSLRGDLGNITSSNAFIVQAIPEMRTKIYEGKDWRAIAKKQADTFFSPSNKEAKEDMDRMVKLYTNDVFDDFLEDPICAECGEKAK